jgi:hypothetical protein
MGYSERGGLFEWCCLEATFDSESSHGDVNAVESLLFLAGAVLKPGLPCRVLSLKEMTAQSA